MFALEKILFEHGKKNVIGVLKMLSVSKKILSANKEMLNINKISCPLMYLEFSQYSIVSKKKTLSIQDFSQEKICDLYNFASFIFLIFYS